MFRLRRRLSGVTVVNFVVRWKADDVCKLYSVELESTGDDVDGRDLSVRPSDQRHHAMHNNNPPLLQDAPRISKTGRVTAIFILGLSQASGVSLRHTNEKLSINILYHQIPSMSKVDRFRDGAVDGIIGTLEVLAPLTRTPIPVTGYTLYL